MRGSSGRAKAAHRPGRAPADGSAVCDTADPAQSCRREKSIGPQGGWSGAAPPGTTRTRVCFWALTSPPDPHRLLSALGVTIRAATEAFGGVVGKLAEAVERREGMMGSMGWGWGPPPNGQCPVACLPASHLLDPLANDLFSSFLGHLENAGVATRQQKLGFRALCRHCTPKFRHDCEAPGSNPGPLGDSEPRARDPATRCKSHLSHSAPQPPRHLHKPWGRPPHPVTEGGLHPSSTRNTKVCCFYRN